MFSQAGREILIKSVVIATSAYSMALFRYPKSLINQLSILMVAQFWWGEKDKERKLCGVSRMKATFPKRMGGMGFRDFEKFNIACLSKQVWRLISQPNSLWAKIIKGIYFPHTSFWNAQSKNHASWF